LYLALKWRKLIMNTIPSTNQRLITILLVLLIVLVVLLILGTVFGFLVRGGMTLAPGASTGVGSGMMMGMNGQTMNDMMAACIEMMQNFQNP
jgi:tetrahydromethanopterin S-methyltransferase subunit D